MGVPEFEGIDVIVAGAGPVGLMMACGLVARGVRCLLVDDQDGPTPLNESRALGIQARTMEIFGQIGVANRVLAEGLEARGLGVYYGARQLTRLRFDLSGRDSQYRGPLILPQSRTERILLDRLVELGGAVAWGNRLGGVVQDDSGVVATLLDGAGSRRELRAGWLVGCDGARSVVRHALDLKFEGGEYEELFLIADLHVGWEIPRDELAFVLTPDGPLVSFPLPEPGHWRLVDTTGMVDAREPGAIVARFRELVTRNMGEGIVVDQPTWTSSFRIHRRVVDRYRSGRCFVAGDAAHLHSPAGGQGMNTGLQDAHNLAWKLSLVVQGQGREALLDSYGPERRPVAVGVLKGSDRATRLVTLRNPLARALRNGLIVVLSRLRPIARMASLGLSELAVGYRGSPIVAEDAPGWLGGISFAAGPRPGDRAPDVLIEPGRPGPWLSDFQADPRHLLLLFEGLTMTRHPGGDGDSILGLVDDRYADLIRTLVVARSRGGTPDDAWGRLVSDPQGSLHRRYGAKSPCLYLIRPDGYVGYRAMPPDLTRFRGFLDRIFP